MATAVLGRQLELTTIAQLLDERPTGPLALIIEGDAGIGKTTLWEAALDLARQRSWRVLAARPAEAEARFSYGAARDLLGTLVDETIDRLPGPQRRAVETAFLRAEGRANPHAVSAGVLGILRAASGSGPVLVAIDDLQWLDAASARVLEFALRRMTAEPVGVLAASRPPGTGHVPLKIERAFGGQPLHTVVLGPMPAGEVREALQVLAAAPRAPAALVTAAAGEGSQMMTGLAEAEDAGIVARTDGRLEFTHPLLASVVYAQIPPALRRRTHRAVAAALDGSTPGVPADPVARARHLALGAEGPDAGVAETLEAAAGATRALGAPEGAAELAELARRLTPPGRDRDRARRTLDLAQYLFEAGDTSAARSELAALVRQMAPGPDRARVLLLLATVLYWAESQPAGSACARQAVAEAGLDPSLLAEAHALAAQVSDHANRERGVHARQALELLARQPHPDPRILASSLLALAMARYYTGEGVSRKELARAIELEAALAERPAVSRRARTVLGEFLKYTDDFAGARVILDAAHREAVEEGDESSLPDILGHRAELELWWGDWERAARYADECVQAAERTGQELLLGVNWYVRGLVNAHLGRADVARRDAEAALASGERRGDLWVIGLSLWVLGFVELSLGRLAEVGQHLSRAWEIGATIGLAEPGQWRFHADHLEALIGLGELDRAAGLLGGFQDRARATGRPWALATAARCRALMLAARGDWPADERDQARVAEHHAVPRRRCRPPPGYLIPAAAVAFPLSAHRDPGPSCNN